MYMNAKYISNLRNLVGKILFFITCSSFRKIDQIWNKLWNHKDWDSVALFWLFRKLLGKNDKLLHMTLSRTHDPFSSWRLLTFCFVPPVEYCKTDKVLAFVPYNKWLHENWRLCLYATVSHTLIQRLSFNQLCFPILFSYYFIDIFIQLFCHLFCFD